MLVTCQRPRRIDAQLPRHPSPPPALCSPPRRPPPYRRMIELMRLAEQHGFEYAWTYDSHILWEESYATLPLAAAQTSKIKLGHFVTNPGIRDPTITASWYATMQDISDGRMVMGIGRGDSSRRVVGLKPVRVAE